MFSSDLHKIIAFKRKFYPSTYLSGPSDSFLAPWIQGGQKITETFCSVYFNFDPSGRGPPCGTPLMMLLVWTFRHCCLKCVIFKLMRLCMALALIRICRFPGYYWLILSVSLVTARARALARVHPGYYSCHRACARLLG